MSNYDYIDSYWPEMDCHRVGISGGCGGDCPVLLCGDCDIEDEMLEIIGAPDIDSIGEECKPEENKYSNYDKAMEILK